MDTEIRQESERLKEKFRNMPLDMSDQKVKLELQCNKSVQLAREASDAVLQLEDVIRKYCQQKSVQMDPTSQDPTVRDSMIRLDRNESKASLNNGPLSAGRVSVQSQIPLIQLGEFSTQNPSLASWRPPADKDQTQEPVRRSDEQINGG